MTRNVTVLSGVSLAQDAASELLYPLLPILLTSVLGAPAAVVGIVEGIAEGVAAALKYVAGAVSDRVGRKRAITVGYSLAPSPRRPSWPPTPCSTPRTRPSPTPQAP
jgi:MFS family permease